VCCSVLQCVVVCCSVLQWRPEQITRAIDGQRRCRVLQCVAVCCKVLLLYRAAVCWNVLQRVAVGRRTTWQEEAIKNEALPSAASVHTYINSHTSTYTHTHTHTHTHSQIYTHPSTKILETRHIHTNTHIHAYANIHTHVSRYAFHIYSHTY